MARSTVSFGMLAWRAARTAALSRGFAAGSGSPIRAAVVNSRMILVNTLPRFLSCAPLRNMMFLNCEWPAIQTFSRKSPVAQNPGRKHASPRIALPAA
jgi:hypothetical protein